MKLHWKAGVPALVFTAVFLLLPGFRAGWPGVWAVASLCIWLPAYVWDERAQPAPQSGCLPAAVRRRPFAYSAFYGRGQPDAPASVLPLYLHRAVHRLLFEGFVGKAQ